MIIHNKQPIKSVINQCKISIKFTIIIELINMEDRAISIGYARQYVAIYIVLTINAI